MTLFTLGNRFSALVAVQPAHRLKTNGVYRFVRHPSYLGALLAMVGWTLVFRSGPGLLLALLMIPFVLVRIQDEERFLAVWLTVVGLNPPCDRLDAATSALRHSKLLLLQPCWASASLESPAVMRISTMPRRCVMTRYSRVPWKGEKDQGPPDQPLK
jgi:Isoprenylcysteine carboxyl methyltransferase (ICMT) family